MYVDEMFSADEIAELLTARSGVKITPRSVGRWLSKMGVMRPIGDAFRNAAKRGRIEWVYKAEKIKRVVIARKLRYEILKRDKFKCVLCGATAQTTLLEMDHKIPVCKGGLNTKENLRTLCYDCNVGKRIVDVER